MPRDTELKRSRYIEKAAQRRGVPVQDIPTRQARSRDRVLEDKFAWMRERQAAKPTEIEFPRREHAHCDPICDSCAGVFRQYGDILRPIVESGLRAFWDHIQQRAGALHEAFPSFSESEITQMRADGLAMAVDCLFTERSAPKGAK